MDPGRLESTAHKCWQDLFNTQVPKAICIPQGTCGADVPGSCSAQLSLFPHPVPPNSMGETEFYGFVDCLLQSRINYERRLWGGAKLLSDVEENVVGIKFQAVNFPGQLMPPRRRGLQAFWPQESPSNGLSKWLALMPMRTRSHFWA